MIIIARANADRPTRVHWRGPCSGGGSRFTSEGCTHSRTGSNESPTQSDTRPTTTVYHIKIVRTRYVSQCRKAGSGSSFTKVPHRVLDDQH